MFALSTLLLAASALAAPVPVRREVPQEHSHEKYLVSVRNSLNLNNPAGIVDPVFALLGNAAAATGAGSIADPDCLQQAVADQAFTNAKAAGNLQGQVDALVFRALERNSLSVGGKTNLCTSLQATNPEIAPIQQHQDAASDGAAALNKAITLELAKQIASIGGDPLIALDAGTFAPGQIGDPTARGNSCNDPNDAQGCIFTENLLVADATEEEILAAAGAAPGEGEDEEPPAEETVIETPTETATEAPVGTDCPENVVVTVTVTADADAPAPTEAPAETPAPPADANNLQKFTGALGGAVAPKVNAGGRGFVVEGSDDFLNVAAALGRSCDIQKNQCANISNGNRAAGFSVGDCDRQAGECRALI